MNISVHYNFSICVKNARAGKKKPGDEKTKCHLQQAKLTSRDLECFTLNIFLNTKCLHNQTSKDPKCFYIKHNIFQYITSYNETSRIPKCFYIKHNIFQCITLYNETK